MTIEEAGKKRTPGEWKLEKFNFCGSPTDVGFAINRPEHNPEEHHSIASLGLYEHVGYWAGLTAEQIEANATLLSKAYLLPELVAALESALPELAAWSTSGDFRPQDERDDYSAALALVTAVLAKVRE